MRTTYGIAIGCALLFALTADCALADIPASPTTDVMAAEFRGVLAGDLPEATSNAAAIYQKYCSDCHRMVSPLHHTASEWRLVLNRMRDRIKSANKELPSDSDWMELQSYIVRFAKEAK